MASRNTAIHRGFMREAISLSLKNVRDNKGGPFAALIVKDNAIISRGINLVTSEHDPTAHAEIVAIRRACAHLKTFRLDDCVIYTTCEPCPMCLGAIYWARLEMIYYANSRADAARIGFDDKLIYQQFPLPISRRKIPAVRLMHNEALAAFRVWEEDENKIIY